MTVRSICLHGPESTGKSTVGPRLASSLGTPYVAEYGRNYAETHGTEFTMADLLAIAKEHDRLTRVALQKGPYPVIVDTDPLVTAVWAEMLFGRRDPWFDEWHDTADFYLLFDIDLPWVDDGTRMFGSVAARQRFFDLCRAELDRRRLPWTLIGGQGEQRYLNAAAATRRVTDTPTHP